MDVALKTICSNYQEIKQKKVNSVEDFFKLASDIQDLSTALHFTLINLATKEPDFFCFLSKYNQSLKEIESLKDQKITFSIIGEEIVIKKNNKVLLKNSLLSPERLTELYYKKNNSEVRILIELFFSHQYSFGLGNFLSFLSK